MTRYRKFIDTDVYTEAKKRIRHIFDIFDTVVVLFSGGKDSLTILHLVKEIRDERGIKDPINVVFLDEEVIQDNVINFVNEYRQKDWVNMKWFCVPLQSYKCVLGKTEMYYQWDPKRTKYVRQKPSWAITLPQGDNRLFDQYTLINYYIQFFKGKVALINGMRGQESIIRLRSALVKLNENYICASKNPRTMLCKPIFDWTEDDIFKYLYDNQIPYCQTYNNALFASQRLRVSTPLHIEAAKQFFRLRVFEPDFYQRVVDVFPEMIVQEKYYQSYQQNQEFSDIKTYDDVLKYINANIDDMRVKALMTERVKEVMKKKTPQLPPDKLLKRALATGWKRRLTTYNKTNKKT